MSESTIDWTTLERDLTKAYRDNACNAWRTKTSPDPILEARAWTAHGMTIPRGSSAWTDGDRDFLSQLLAKAGGLAKVFPEFTADQRATITTSLGLSKKPAPTSEAPGLETLVH